MKNIIFILLFTSLTIVLRAQLSCPNVFKCGDTLVDTRDNYKYPTVKIGTQCWFSKNLEETKYLNGDSIKHISNTPSWASLTTGAWIDYNNDASNGVIYGHLYNWFAATDNRSICPKGWYVPTEAEWQILINFTGGPSNAGPGLKANSPLWNPNPGTDTTGFAGMPGGNLYYSDEQFVTLDCSGNIWSSTGYSATNAIVFTLYSGCGAPASANLFGVGKQFGFSVRCMKDN